jgi:hypothetical protein
MQGVPFKTQSKQELCTVQYGCENLKFYNSQTNQSIQDSQKCAADEIKSWHPNSSFPFP